MCKSNRPLKEKRNKHLNVKPPSKKIKEDDAVLFVSTPYFPPPKIPIDYSEKKTGIFPQSDNQEQEPSIPTDKSVIKVKSDALKEMWI